MGNLPMSWASASGRIIARAVSVPDLVMRTAGYDGATQASVQQSAAVPTSGRALAVWWRAGTGGGCAGRAVGLVQQIRRRGRVRLQVGAEEQQAPDLDGGRVRGGAGGRLPR